MSFEDYFRKGRPIKTLQLAADGVALGALALLLPPAGHAGEP
jgi:hypothetical protein